MNKNKWIFGAALLLFAACTQDELTEQGDTLPEGMYPLQIASVTMEAESSVEPWGAKSPQTRVAESADRNSSVWQDDDKINVQIGNGTPGVYTYRDGKLEVANGDAPAYWASTDNGQTITAWYTSSGSKTVDLSKQINTLAYVLTAREIADFNQTVSLAFSHALAKVRVILEEEKAGEVKDVLIKTYTGCTLSADDKLSADGKQEYIPMVKTTYKGKTCWEANVMPNLALKDDAFQLVVDENPVKCSITEVVPQAGQLHIITLTVIKKYEVVDVSTITTEEYTVDGKVHLKGNKEPKELKITVKEGSKLILDNVNLTPKSGGNVITCEGSTTLILSGNNNIESDADMGNHNEVWSGILIKNGTLTIEGSGELKVVGKGIGPGIGAVGGAAIVINGGTINASSNPRDPSYGSPGIGVPAVGDAPYTYRCGNITINGGHVTAQGGGGAAGIGTGVLSDCGDILIQGENTVVIAKKGQGNTQDIGNGDSGGCGTITFRNGATVNETKYY